MPTTITLKNLGAFAGATNLQLFLRKTSDNTLLAAGGDTGVDADSIGSFAWTIDEEIPSEQLLARIYEGSTETAANIVIDSVLNVGFTEIGQEAAELNTEALRAALGMAAADLDDQLDAILAAGGGAGTGARTVTITVNDGTTVLQNATVRMTEGVNTFTALTNASGVAVFNLDDATYTVSITKSGYSYTGTTLVVNGTETATYSMTAISVTPPTSPSKSAIEVLCVDENVDAESGVAVDFRIVTIPTGDQNIAYKGTKQTATSDVDGIARFEVARGSVCEYKRGEADVWQRVTVDNDSVTNVTSFIGSP